MPEYLDEFSELKRVRESCGICHYELAGQPSPQLAAQIVDGLPTTRELMFFDPYYPSPSDPGAYISVRRTGDRYLYAFGNHGWSQPWSRQSRSFLVQYLLLCLPAHRPSVSPERLRLTPVLLEDVARLFERF